MCMLMCLGAPEHKAFFLLQLHFLQSHYSINVSCFFVCLLTSCFFFVFFFVGLFIVVWGGRVNLLLFFNNSYHSHVNSCLSNLKAF